MIEKYNQYIKEHIHYLTDEEDVDYDPNEIMELVGLPSGLYLTMFRKEYSPKLKEIITWSENLKMYTYRDKDYSKVMYILDIKQSNSESPKFKQAKIGRNLTANLTSSITTLLRRWNIDNYVINGNKVTVDGDVTIKYETFSQLPVVFQEVSGDFTIMYCALETLENCPQYVGGNFNVSNNRLRTLEGGPKGVGKDYDCSYNYLRDLRGSPERVINFNCKDNSINTLKGSPIYVEGDFDCSNNLVTSFKDGPVSVKGNLNCQGNLIKDIDRMPFLVKKINMKNNPINDKN